MMHIKNLKVAMDNMFDKSKKYQFGLIYEIKTVFAIENI